MNTKIYGGNLICNPMREEVEEGGKKENSCTTKLIGILSPFMI